MLLWIGWADGLLGCVVLVLALRVGILGLLFCVAVWLCILLLVLGVVGRLVLGVGAVVSSL